MNKLETIASLVGFTNLINRSIILNNSIKYTKDQLVEYPRLQNQLDTLELEADIFMDNFNSYMTDEVKTNIQSLIKN